MPSSLPSTTRGVISALVLASAVHAKGNFFARDDSDAYTEPSTDCHDIHIFLARGNNEVAGATTRQTSVVQAVCDGRKSCGWEDIDYDNPMDNKYAEACHQGAVNGLKQIRSYGEDCPDSKLVLTGYSQGAHVVGDMLGGGGGTFETMGGGEHMGENSTEEYVEGLDQDSSPGNQSKYTILVAVEVLRFASLRQKQLVGMRESLSLMKRENFANNLTNSRRGIPLGRHTPRRRPSLRGLGRRQLRGLVSPQRDRAR